VRGLAAVDADAPPTDDVSVPGGFEPDDALWTALEDSASHDEMRAVLKAWIKANEVYWAEARPSPAGWVPPVDRRPGWDWTPPTGLLARPTRMPLWVRLWYHLPAVDRFAYEWMWHHGGFDALPPGHMPGDPTGVREPRRPNPPLPSESAARETTPDSDDSSK
jgi:hypothetical protein